MQILWLFLVLLFLGLAFPMILLFMTGMIIMSDLAIGWIIVGTVLGICLSAGSFFLAAHIALESDL